MFYADHDEPMELSDNRSCWVRITSIGNIRFAVNFVHR